MQSGSVNASLLLSSYLGNEHEKIGHEIARSDFAGELGKLFTQNANPVDPAAASNPAVNSTERKTASTAEQPASTQSEGNAAPANTPDQATRPARPCRNKSASTGPRERIENLKSQAKNSEKLYITNPALVASILAELRYPAETINAYKSMQNQEGLVSLKDFKALLASRPVPSDPRAEGRVPAVQAQTLLAAIVQKVDKDPASGRETFTAAKSAGAPAVKPSTDGVYNISEFRALIDQVLQQATTADVRQKSATAATSSASGSSGTTTGGGEITGQAVVGPRQGQTESLAGSILPSFVSGDSEEPGRKKAATGTQVKSNPDSAKGFPVAAPEATAARKGTQETDSLSSALDAERRAAANTRPDQPRVAPTLPAGPGREGDLDRFTAVADTQSPGKSAPAAQTGIAAAPSGPADRIGSGEAGQILASIAEEFGAKIVSLGTDTPPASQNAAEPQNVPREPAAFQDRNLSVLAREAVKDSGEKTSAPGARVEQNLSETPLSPGRIVTPRAENPQDEPFPGQDPNRAAGLVRNLRDQAGTTGKNDSMEFPGADGEYAQARNGAEAANTARGTVAASRPETSPGAAPGFTSQAEIPLRAESTISPRAEKPPVEPFSGLDSNRAAGVVRNLRDQAQTAGQGDRKDAPAIERDIVQTQGGAEAKEVRLPPVSMLDKPASCEADASRGISGEGAQAEQASPGPGRDVADPVDVVQKSGPRMTPREKPPVLGHEAAVLAKEVEKNLKAGDHATDAAGLQTAEIRFTGSRIEVSRMDQAPNGGLSYHDPSETAEALRERFGSAGGRHLVLDVEPEEFGKMSIRIGTRGDEVSAVVLTENESARQALLKNSPDLRQELENQGLLLGKFQVDVGREKAGGGNNPEWQKPEGKNADESAAGTINPGGRTQPKPSYIRRNGSRSQVSIFA
ncbi:MAG: flagellar hook-length control protein FliK [Syntrophobacteraceae bacterium]